MRRASRFAWLGWGIFLGTSWTWCIGMFLPVLLVRDLGIGGFVVFAVPNVLGAAAMGWVVHSVRQSEDLIRRHERACIWFSLVTIAFHAFFTAWIIRRVAGPEVGIVSALVLAAFLLVLHPPSGKIVGAILTLGVSLIAMIWGYHHGSLPNIAQKTSDLPTSDLVYFTPVCLFGFLLCPYLDLTFHAARRRLSSGQAIAAFTFGFVVIFLLMILFTLAYSGWLAEGWSRRLHPQWAMFLAAHLIVQSCFTVAVHAEQLFARTRAIRPSQFFGFCALLAVTVILGSVDRSEYLYHGLRMGEIVYRCFLGFYALAFPAYVWLRMFPPRQSPLVLAGTIAIASPMFWMAFVEQEMFWLIPGILVAFGAKYLPHVGRR